MGSCCSGTNNKDQISVFEQTLPIVKLELMDYEKKVKDLTQKDIQDEIELRKFIEAFKNQPEFSEIKDKESLIRKILQSRFLKVNMVDAESVIRKLEFDNTKSKGPGVSEEAEKQKIWYTGLLLLGILYCKGTDVDKATVFHNLSNKDQSDELTNPDEDLRILYTKLIIYATIFAEHFAEVSQNKLVNEYDKFDAELLVRAALYE